MYVCLMCLSTNADIFDTAATATAATVAVATAIATPATANTTTTTTTAHVTSFYEQESYKLTSLIQFLSLLLSF